jgi:hypothetical protein
MTAYERLGSGGVHADPEMWHQNGRPGDAAGSGRGQPNRRVAGSVHFQRMRRERSRSRAKRAQRADPRRQTRRLPGIQTAGLHGTCHRCGRTMGDAGAVRHAYPLGGQLHAPRRVSDDGSRGRCAGGALRRRRALPRSVQSRRRHLRGPRESHHGQNAWGGYLRGGPVSHGNEGPLLGVWGADTNN